MPAILLNTKRTFQREKRKSFDKKGKEEKDAEREGNRKERHGHLSDVARRTAGPEGRPDFHTVHCCVSLDKSAALSEPL